MMRGRSRAGGAKIAVLAAVCLVLAACGTTRRGDLSEIHPGGAYKVGDPYTVNGVTYQPRVQPNYDEVGMASWYGPEFHGRYTANGELFDMNKLTAAHRTLPMPSYVRVTNLDNGRSLVLRVNDRGPFARNRIIDVSRRAAQLLGFERSGTARVRVQAVTETAEAPGDDPRPAVPLPAPDNRVVASAADRGDPSSGASSSGLFVQIGAFGTEAKAEEVLDRARALGPASIAPIEVGGRTLYRVRLGPYGSDQEAEGARAGLSANGFPDAKIVND